jgi:chromate reductase
MGNKKEILAIPGSMRQHSMNLGLIKAIIRLCSDSVNIKIYEELSTLPHFSPDLDNDIPPSEVSNFRKQLKGADGILICTPEYAMGVPGTLKNAIDWIVSSMELSHKPVALITASTAGQKAHGSLLDTLRIIESNISDGSQLLISHIKTKIKDDQIIDPDTLQQVRELVHSLLDAIHGNLNVDLSADS